MSYTISDFKAFMTRKDNAAWVVFGSFALFAFIKSLLFNHFAFPDSSLSDMPVGRQCGAMLIKAALAVGFASFTFLFRDKRWMILLSFIIDAWCIANLIYMRNNHILLDGEAFNQAGNLHGYSSSILIYIEWGIDLLFLGLTALWSCIFFFITPSHSAPRLWFYTLLSAVVLRAIGGVLLGSWGYNLIDRDERETVLGWSFSRAVEQTSILESPAYVISDYFAMRYKHLPVHPMATDDYLTADSCCLVADSIDSSDPPLIIILVESLENWVCRADVMPNLYGLSKQEHVLYADHVHTQIVGAPSADGQMIVNTGLLPINAGATCLHYPHNTYPSLMSSTDNYSVCLLPHDPCVWNQTEMSPAFGYDTTIVFSDVDTLLFAKLNQLVDSGERYIQCITQSTHAPFVNERLSHLELPSDMPWVMRNYIRGFNALDQGLGLFINKLYCDSALQNYTIVITGDHRILHREKRRQMLRYCSKHDLDYDAGSDCLPLIIYSPRIEGNIRIRSDVYQMDIYPTVVRLIDSCYYWRGMGIDLLDSASLANRQLSADEAATLSDRLIRNNYFEKK